MYLTVLTQNVDNGCSASTVPRLSNVQYSGAALYRILGRLIHCTVFNIDR